MSMQSLVKEHLDCEDQNDFEKSIYVFGNHWICTFRDCQSGGIILCFHIEQGMAGYCTIEI